MKLSRRSAIFIILVCAGIPLTVFPAILVFFGFQGHERILEKSLESLTGLPVEVEGLQSENVNLFSVGDISIGKGLCRIEGAEARCSFNPFCVETLHIRNAECDLTGTNPGVFMQMIEHIREKTKDREYSGFSAFSKKLTIVIDMHEKAADGDSARIELCACRVHSDTDGEVYSSADSAYINGKPYTFRFKGRHRFPSSTGTVAFSADTGIANLFSEPHFKVSSASLRGTASYSCRDAGGDGTVWSCIFNLFDESNTNQVLGKADFQPARGVVDLKGLKTDLGKVLDLVSLRTDEYITVSGGEFTGKGTVQRTADGAGAEFSLTCEIEKPVIEFNKDMALDTGTLYFSELSRFSPSSLRLQGRGLFSRLSESSYRLETEYFRGIIGNSETFWDVKGKLEIDRGALSSDITALLYQVPLSCARSLFILYKADHSWMEKCEGPVDISMSGFDVNAPDKTPIVFSSGSRGIRFWIKDRLPRMDGIYFNKMKLYLPPLEKKQ